MTDDETWVDGDHANTLNRFDVGDTRTTHIIVEQASTLQARGKTGNGADITAAKVECSPALTKVKSERGVHVAEHMSVRRLTPVECERLMGLPDGWTAPEGVQAPDSKRYAACGDAIVTTVAFWIADRIRMIEEEEAS
jgi:DNA (cytosine-5)-methyltransferase 1